LGQKILAALRDNLLLRASVATVAGIVLLGVASGALPIGCFVRLAACEASPLTADETAPIIVPNGKGVSGGVAVKTVAEIAPPTLTRNDVVAATFEMLDFELSPPPASEGELKTRVVTTVAIGPDGQPEGLATPAPAVAPLVPEELALSATPAPMAPVVGTIAAAGTPTAATEHSTAVATELAVEPPAPTGQPEFVVKGSGANVHTGPAKASKVLFALNPGVTVILNDEERGWMKVTDEDGRTGWVWEELLVRQ
jgi:hypothetical protein